MERIEKTFDIDCPVHTVYNQWTQFEEFPRFMEGVKETRQLDDTHVHWKVSIAGKEKEFDTEIVEQVPDECIAWRSVSGAQNAGMVRFEPLNKERTRVELTMEYEPQTFAEKAADAVGIGAEHDAADRAGDEAHAECRERQHQAHISALRGEEGVADLDREERVGDEVIEFQRIAGGGSQDGAAALCGFGGNHGMPRKLPCEDGHGRPKRGSAHF